MVADGALKLDYADMIYWSILEFKSMTLNLILLRQLLSVTRKVTGGSYLSKSICLSAHKTR